MFVPCFEFSTVLSKDEWTEDLANVLKFSTDMCCQA